MPTIVVQLGSDVPDLQTKAIYILPRHLTALHQPSGTFQYTDNYIKYEGKSQLAAYCSLVRHTNIVMYLQL
jgi:hypothetical protein